MSSTQITNENNLNSKFSFISSLEKFISNNYTNKLFIDTNIDQILIDLINTLKIDDFQTFSISTLQIQDFHSFLRQSTKLLFKTNKDIYEGELLELKYRESKIEITLMTSKESKTVYLSILNKDLLKNINIGDILYIEPNIGIIKRLGRSERKINEYDLEGDRYLPISKKPVHQIKEKDYEISFYDLDYSFNKYNKNISEVTRKQVDEFVNNKIKEGICLLSKSLIIIKNSHYLKEKDLEMIKEITNKYKFYKFILIGNKELIKNKEIYKKEFLLLNYSEEDFIKKFIEENQNLINKEITVENYEIIKKIMKISKDEIELKENLKIQFNN